jgi:hypothetical protein
MHGASTKEMVCRKLGRWETVIEHYMFSSLAQRTGTTGCVASQVVGHKQGSPHGSYTLRSCDVYISLKRSNVIDILL